MQITRATGKLFLFSTDQKIEHLNADFQASPQISLRISPDAQNPEHFFKIARSGSVGALATQFGLIAHYGKDYPTISYIVKLNSKTNLVPTAAQDPYSAQLNTVCDALRLKRSSDQQSAALGIQFIWGAHMNHKCCVKLLKWLHKRMSMDLFNFMDVPAR